MSTEKVILSEKQNTGGPSRDQILQSAPPEQKQYFLCQLLSTNTYSLKSQIHKVNWHKVVLKNINFSETSLVVQWLRLSVSKQGVQVQSLVWALRSRMLLSVAKNKLIIK